MDQHQLCAVRMNLAFLRRRNSWRVIGAAVDQAALRKEIDDALGPRPAQSRHRTTRVAGSKAVMPEAAADAPF
jgi:hypothetical protein